MKKIGSLKDNQRDPKNDIKTPKPYARIYHNFIMCNLKLLKLAKSSIGTYHIVPKFSDRQVWANSTAI